MRLKVIESDAGVPGGRAIMLADEAGQPLPNQRKITLVNGVDETTVITVEFLVDGEHIRIACEEPTA